MALSLADKLRQAAAVRMAQTAGETTARLDDMDAKAGLQSLPPKRLPKLPTALRRAETAAPDDKTEQDTRAGQLSRTTEQDNQAGQLSTRAGQLSNRAGQLSRTIEQDNRAGQLSRTIEQDNRAGQLSRTTEQDNRAGQPSRTIEQAKLLTLLLPAAAPARTTAQKTVLAYFARYGSHVSNYDKIIAETGLPLATVRRTVNKFVSLGILTKSVWRSGSVRGLQFTFRGTTEQDNRAPQLSRTTEQDNRAPQLSRTTEQDNQAGQPSASLLKIDRKNLSISLETLTTCWPTLVKAGFGLDQLRQIERTLLDQGKDTSRVFQGLDHAECELERGQMLDRDNQPVADPCSWVFAALARTGYYRRPRGYVSPEEQAAKDAETEARAVIAARQAAEQAQFEAWRDGLSAEELSAVMRGHPGGSKEAWLKKRWRERFRGDVASPSAEEK
jgi:hypothetical protein